MKLPSSTVLIRLFRAMMVLIILIMAFNVEEDWRGAHDWAACQRDLAAKGESLDLRQLAPPGNPEDDLSKVPIFSDIYDKSVPYEKRRMHRLNTNLGHNADQPKLGEYRSGKAIDLLAWQKFYRALPEAGLSGTTGTPAQDVLKVLSRFDADLNEIDTAVSRPGAFWPIDYDKPFSTTFGGITSMISLSKILALRGAAHLGNNQTDLTEQDYLFSFRLNHPLTKNCFMISCLVMVGVQAVDDSILWEGLHRHAWTDAQLREMESQLAETDMLALGATGLRTERASALPLIETMQDKNSPINQSGWVALDNEMSALSPLIRLRPRGWVNQDKCHYTFGVQSLIDGIDSAHGTVSFFDFIRQEEKNESEKKMWKMGRFFYTPVSATTLPVISNYSRAIIRAETNRRFARLACRLEEYWLARGNYPAKLDELPDLPAHLNQEVFSNQPLHYQLREGSYLLYSIGWNQTDEGGLQDKDEKKGDWTWLGP